MFVKLKLAKYSGGKRAYPQWTEIQFYDNEYYSCMVQMIDGVSNSSINLLSIVFEEKKALEVCIQGRTENE